jgi:hypothetical protein
MDIIKRKDKKEVYTVKKLSKNSHAVVKVLNIYESENEAFKTVLDLLQGIKKEEELLQEYIKKDI